MDAAATRLEFAPPPTPGMVRALGLAIIAHALLVAALTWGVSWKRDAVTLTAEAELWSTVPQEAAPRLVETPPPPLQPSTAPVAEPAPPPPDVAPAVPDAEIVMAREKKRLEKEKAIREQKLAKLAADKQRLEEKREADKKATEDKRRADLKLAEQKRSDQKLVEQAAKRKEALQAQEDTRKIEAQREENIKRMAGLAGATGSTNATGAAQQSSGPSPSYGGRIRARIKPNIVFTEEIVSNPTAEVEVRTSPDGTIIGRKLLKSSGVRSWDDAVLKAIDKTEVLPRDLDGRVPPTLVISFRPKD